MTVFGGPCGFTGGGGVAACPLRSNKLEKENLRGLVVVSVVSVATLVDLSFVELVAIKKTS
jgi:hypothetical protein